MKKQPVQNVSRPTYPTLYQVNSRIGNVPIKKIAVVSALTASMALASGCLEGSGSTKSMKRFEKMGAKYGEKIETEEVLMGDTETYIEGGIETYLDGAANTVATDDYVLMGEATPETYELMGEETVDPDYTESYEISGDVSING